MKGIIILEFDENDNLSISTQFPVNICEFLEVTPKVLKPLSDQHLTKKMEPNYLEMKLNDEVIVSSFYTGFSFRHYVGKPNYAIIVFLSEDDFLIDDFEGMMRRIAYELLPKREALNFDDIFGKYYDMLKNGELTPYWEETIEGETSKVVREENQKKKESQNGEIIEEKEDARNVADEKVDASNIKTKLKDLHEKNTELETLLQEKISKIRELTNKFTEIKSENTTLSTELDSLKKELSEQYIKLEKWSQQMADLNENNAKLMIENKNLSSQITKKVNEGEQKEKQIKDLEKKLQGLDGAEQETKKIIQEKEDLRIINRNLNTEVSNLEKMVSKLDSEIEKAKNQNTIHIDTITSLKLEIQNFKKKQTANEDVSADIKNQIFDLKKEVKVLRRERDHYMNIVKKNNLL